MCALSWKPDWNSTIPLLNPVGIYERDVWKPDWNSTIPLLNPVGIYECDVWKPDWKSTKEITKIYVCLYCNNLYENIDIIIEMYF